MSETKWSNLQTAKFPTMAEIEDFVRAPSEWKEAIYPAAMLLALAKRGFVSQQEARKYLAGGGGFKVMGGPQIVDELVAELERLAGQAADD